MEILPENLPKHIGIIMDGNRRWAKEHGLPIKQGHKKGAETIENIVRYANQIGIKYLTVYAFSTENWKRTEEEVGALMFLFKSYLDDYSKRADTENIKVKILGNISGLSEDIQKTAHICMERTENNTGITFNILINYGGRDELVRGIRKIASQVQDGILNIDDIDEQTVSNSLYTAGQPDPDLVIRTSGELRTSNFLPWQIVYSEFLFIDKYWPDFGEEDLDYAIEVFQKRNQRKGS